jgi:hypothetical protein
MFGLAASTRGIEACSSNGSALSSYLSFDEKLNRCNGIRTRESSNMPAEKRWRNANPFPPFNAPTIAIRFIYRFIYDRNRGDPVTSRENLIGTPERSALGESARTFQPAIL